MDLKKSELERIEASKVSEYQETYEKAAKLQEKLKDLEEEILITTTLLRLMK